MLQIGAEHPQNEVNPHYLAFTAGETQNAFTNKAYDGVSLKPGLTYEVSFYARAEGYAGGIEVSVEKNSTVMAQAVIATAVGKSGHAIQRSLAALSLYRMGISSSGWMRRARSASTSSP